MLRALFLLSIVMLAGAEPVLAQTQTPKSQPATAPAAFVRPPAPGRLIDVGGGRRLHILSKGVAAGPTVIIEAGLSQYTANSTYGPAQDAIAPFARVCTYDRAGLGWSDPAPQGWTQDAMVADLHALLAAAGESGPYVIVAHALGGLLARTYALTYPDDVAGLILLDATSDEDFGELAAVAAATIPQLDAAISASHPGVPLIGMPAGTSPEVVLAFTPEILLGLKTEFEALNRLPADMKRPGGFGDLGDLPLIVVRRGKTEQPPSADDLRHQRVQENLTKLSTNSALIVAQNSGYTISLDEPGVVADAVRRMLEALRTGARLTEAQTEGRAQSSQTQASAAFVKPKAPGRLIDVGGGRRLHILSKGVAAGPTVIIEAGLSQYTANSTYGPAQDAIASFARVCTYDRAGLGWSDPAPEGWTQAAMAADLHALLVAAGEPGPYVIVAHSMGGLLARTYARTYPDDVAGLILLDATSDEDFGDLAAGSAATIQQLDAAINASHPGVPVVGMPAGTSPEVVLAYTPEILRGVKTEFEALDRLPAEMKRPGGFGDLGDLPLIVVRRGKTEQPPSAEDLRHQRVQENLAKLSTDSALIVAHNSGHTISLDEPAVVADAVRRMLDALRTGARLTD